WDGLARSQYQCVPPRIESCLTAVSRAPPRVGDIDHEDGTPDDTPANDTRLANDACHVIARRWVRKGDVPGGRRRTRKPTGTQVIVKPAVSAAHAMMMEPTIEIAGGI